VGRAIARALSQRRVERRDRRTVRWQVHQAAPRFVAGQAAAVLELMSGRPNLPVTTWRPQAHAGHRGRPTVLSNAETFAQVAQLMMRGEADYLHHGTADEPGTTLLTLDGDLDLSRPPTVVEVPFGTGWDEVLEPDRLRRPVLLGGYHGTWVPEGELARLQVSQPQLREIGVTLGAGVVLPLNHGCPVDRTARIVGYLASQSAGRCGPCRNGLPVLAGLLGRISSGQGDKGDIDELMRVAGLVERRGACAHPDGTVRLLRSLLSAFGDETRRHAFGGCSHVTPHGRVGATR
jgi:NADH:ubiquinone oxidoreductase subunit F (NADH-binding)